MRFAVVLLAMSAVFPFLAQKLLSMLMPESEHNDPRTWLEEVNAASNLNMRLLFFA